VKVKVNQGVCTGCELCVGMSPKLFKMGDDLNAVVIREEVPPAMKEECRDTADACPVCAIEVSGV
jgi:ferredoxin